MDQRIRNRPACGEQGEGRRAAHGEEMIEASHTYRPRMRVCRLESTTSPILAVPPGWIAKYPARNM
jgi:hypothetical protein